MVVICGYPGIGTNRFHRMLTNLEYQKDGINYDNCSNFGDIANDKYLNFNMDINDINIGIVTCHAMNYNQVRNHFGNCTIIKLWSEYSIQYLHRFYDVFWKNEVGDTLENAFTTLVYNIKYYKEHGVDKEADILIDIDKSTDKFSKLIKHQVSLHNNKNFLKAISVYQKYGIHAPIIDIINNKPHEQILESLKINYKEAGIEDNV